MSQRISFSRNSDLSSVELNLLADLSRLIVTVALVLVACRLSNLSMALLLSSGPSFKSFKRNCLLVRQREMIVYWWPWWTKS